MTKVEEFLALSKELDRLQGQLKLFTGFFLSPLRESYLSPYYANGERCAARWDGRQVCLAETGSLTWFAKAYRDRGTECAALYLLSKEGRAVFTAKLCIRWEERNGLKTNVSYSLPDELCSLREISGSLEGLLEGLLAHFPVLRTHFDSFMERGEA